jgi:hypothetical protein
LTPTSQNCQEKDNTGKKLSYFCKKFNQHFVGRIEVKL